MTDRKAKLYKIIFEAETFAGRAFDVCLLWAIGISIATVLVESALPDDSPLNQILRMLEWIFTLLFTAEYLLRLFCVRQPWKYATSFYGVVDLLAILPTYLSLLMIGAQSLLVIRGLRLLRIFRILKMVRYSKAAEILYTALRASRAKIIVFLGAVFTIVLILGSVMYLIEGEQHGFANIPLSMYWAVVTMTTVGYGDIVPHTVSGKMIASFIMVLGYCIIAVPTGIVSVEIAQANHLYANTRSCEHCSREGHELDADYCRHCGHQL